MGKRSACRTIEIMVRQATNRFASEGFIGGIAIVGLLLIVAATIIMESLVIGPAIKDPEFYLSISLLSLGTLLVFVSGVLYIYKKRLERNLVVGLLESFTEISLALIEKVKEGTVNSNEVGNLANNQFEFLLQLLEGGASITALKEKTAVPRPHSSQV